MRGGSAGDKRGKKNGQSKEEQDKLEDKTRGSRVASAGIQHRRPQQKLLVENAEGLRTLG